MGIKKDTRKLGILVLSLGRGTVSLVLEIIPTSQEENKGLACNTLSMHGY
jgi:hypothetical protein